MTKQIAGKAMSLGVAGKASAHRVALLGVVDQATTFVMRLVIIPILRNAPRGGLVQRFPGIFPLPCRQDKQENMALKHIVILLALFRLNHLCDNLSYS
jgi:hypothetical protein